MIDIKSMNLEELTEFTVSMGEKPFRAKQLYEWMHVKCASDFDEMTNLSKAFREKLKEEALSSMASILLCQESKQDGTKKYLMELNDKNTIESVFMRYKHGNSVCISSQVGCRMGCRFCASTVGGLIRSLSPSEMLEQIYNIERDTGERVSNCIIMGIGEPFDNYENVIRFIRMLSDKNGLNISQRNITVSTCGIVENIKRLMTEGLNITLAISLHAPNDEIRRTMMPVAMKYSIDEIVKTCREYADTTGRRVTFEYTLVSGQNDSDENAKELAKLLKYKLFHVNLIPLNEVSGRFGKRSVKDQIKRFYDILVGAGMNVSIRRELGSDISAACGQLRNSAPQ